MKQRKMKEKRLVLELRFKNTQRKHTKKTKLKVTLTRKSNGKTNIRYEKEKWAK